MPKLLHSLFGLVLLTACAGPAGSPTPLVAGEPAARTAEERAKGDPAAPVTLIEYGDYQ